MLQLPDASVMGDNGGTTKTSMTWRVMLAMMACPPPLGLRHMRCASCAIWLRLRMAALSSTAAGSYSTLLLQTNSLDDFQVCREVTKKKRQAASELTRWMMKAVQLPLPSMQS